MSLLSKEPKTGRLEVNQEYPVLITFEEMPVPNQPGYLKATVVARSKEQEDFNYFPPQISSLFGQLRTALKIPSDKAISNFEIAEMCKTTHVMVKVVYNSIDTLNSATGVISTRNFRNLQILTDVEVPKEKVKPTKAKKTPVKKAEVEDNLTVEDLGI